MLTSFFKTSKPINFIVVMVYMTIIFVLAHFEKGFEFSETFSVLPLIGKWMLYLFGILVFNFISKKNDLTNLSAYGIVLFAAFLALLPAIARETNVLLSGLFILIALRRIFSLRSGLHIERKLFDAAFWIVIASLFYFWSILFLFVLFYAIFLYANTSYRYWFIPFVGIATVAIFGFSYGLHRGDAGASLLNYLGNTSFDFSPYNEFTTLAGITFLITTCLWSLFNYTKEMRKAFAQRPLYILVIVTLVLAAAIVIVSPDKSSAEWYFFIAPVAIVAANYIERTDSVWFKEMLLWIAVVLPFILLFVR